jgi:hypothetical protein
MLRKIFKTLELAAEKAKAKRKERKKSAKVREENRQGHRSWDDSLKTKNRLGGAGFLLFYFYYTVLGIGNMQSIFACK